MREDKEQVELVDLGAVSELTLGVPEPFQKEALVIDDFRD